MVGSTSPLLDARTNAPSVPGLTSRAERDDPPLGALETPLLSADPVENRAEFVKVYRLDQMKIEARFFAAPNIFVRAKTSDGDCFNRLFAFGLSNHLVATAIGKANVAQHDIEFFGLHDCQSALRIIGD